MSSFALYYFKIAQKLRYDLKFFTMIHNTCLIFNPVRPYDHRMWQSLGSVYRSTGLLEYAIICYNRSISLVQDDVPSIYILANIYVQMTNEPMVCDFCHFNFYHPALRLIRLRSTTKRQLRWTREPTMTKRHWRPAPSWPSFTKLAPLNETYHANSHSFRNRRTSS